MDIVTASFSKSSVSKMFSVHTKTQKLAIREAIYKIAITNKREFSTNLAILSSSKISERRLELFGEIQKKIKPYCVGIKI